MRPRSQPRLALAPAPASAPALIQGPRPEFPIAQALPDGETRASLRINGAEKVGYEFATHGTRPYFHPLVGPSGARLTRYGHPNPVGHEHHKSVWFGHQFVQGMNFWEEPRTLFIRVRHKRVAVYQDGPEWAALAADWEWEGGGRTLLKQQVIAAIEAADNGEYRFDLQSRFESATGEPVELGKTNFGFLGVRVAKTLSVQFGGGTLTKDDGQTDEPNIFAKPSRWVDYSGQSAPGVIEGIAYLDHPDNLGHPAHWHVRRDGWMCASFNLNQPHLIPPDHPLDLRYRLFIHRETARERINAEWELFAATPRYEVKPPEGGLPTIVRKV